MTITVIKLLLNISLSLEWEGNRSQQKNGQPYTENVVRRDWNKEIASVLG